MKKKLFVLLAMGALATAQENSQAASTSCSANQSCKMEQGSCTASWNRDSFVRIGGNYTYAWITPKGNPTFSGNLGGAQGIYEYRPRNSFYGGVKFSWRQGPTHQAGNTRFLLDFDAHERLGYTFAACDRHWEATLFTGLGYRFLSQRLTQPATAALTFNYNEIYVPLGFLLNGQVYHHFYVGFNGIWMPQVYPAVTINPIGGANWITERTLKNFLVEVPFTLYSFCRKFQFEFKPFFEYWQDGKTIAKSAAGFTLGVPQNTYLFVGAELNLGYTF